MSIREARYDPVPVATVAARVAPTSAVAFAEGVESLRDPCAVVASGLASLIHGFVSSYGRRAGARDEEEALTGAIQELVRRTETADFSGIGISDKTIRSLLGGTYETTDFRTADLIATAVRRPTAFHDGSLAVVQNERAKAAVRTTCCGSYYDGVAALAPTIDEYRQSLTGTAA